MVSEAEEDFQDMAVKVSLNAKGERSESTKKKNINESWSWLLVH